MGSVRWTKESLVALVVRIVCGRSTPSTTSSSSSCRSSSGSPPYTNGDGGGGGGGGGGAQGGNNRRILTRSSALQSLKVLRSGRRPSSSLNSALSSSPLSKHSKVSSPVVVGGAYARHYHSYRTSSGSGRRVNSQSKTAPQLLQPPPLSRVKRRRSLRSTKGRRRSLTSPPHLVPQHDPPKLRSTTREKGDDDEEDEEEVNGVSGNGSSSSKRRSALWVLNCEAEEFLFGETAADKHELELPPPPPALELIGNGNGSEEDRLTRPLSPPPAKKQRRRWRETELSHLLETSPFLESKLRSSSSSTSSSSSSDDPRSPPTPTSNLHHPPSAKRRRVTAKKPKGGGESNQNGNSNSHPPHFLLPPPKLLQPTPPQPQQPPPPPELPASTTPPSLVASLPFTFSFEEPPSESLLWESHSPIMSFAPPISLGEPPPFRLPYESRRVLNRGGLFSRRLKVPRHARKSPRCHASTLAIVAATTEENPSPSPTPTVPPPTVATSGVPPGPMSPLSRWVHETTAPPPQPSPLRRSRRTATTTTNIVGGLRSLGTGSSGSAGNSLSAQQFLWDSIQWLSDPYVVALLAGEELPSAPIPISSPAPPPPQSSSASAATSVNSSNERKASLRRPKNGVVSTSKAKPTINGKVKGSNGIVKLDQMNGKVKKQPVVIMEDIMKSKDPPQLKETPQVAPLLFMSGDGLPPLIPWTA